ncbi:MAG TPA: autotransporter outer membrane beta-barrel domain-containing protein, partial [Roseomonas sp.]
GVIARNGGTVRVTGTEVTTGFLPDNVPAVLDYDLVTQRGLEAHGVEVADAGSVVRVNDGSAITTLGAGAIGVLARDQGTAIITDSNITTNGASTANFTADGARATGAGSSITLTGAGVATYGADAAGLRALDHSTITATDATVETQERNAFGAHAQDAGSTITLTGGSIRTVGPSSDGLRVTGGGTIIVTGTEVTTGYYPDYGNTNGGPSPTYLLAEAGQEAHAAEVAGAGSLLRAENARITTTGTGAIGVLASGGGTAIITGGTIWTEGGRTPDFTADGARATGAGSSITLTGTAVTAQNTDAAGLRALQGGLVAATDVTILTNGQNGFGAHAQDAGSVITLTRGSIATTGDGAIGIQASSAGAVQISGGSVTASGAAAHGLAGIDGGTITAAGTAVAVTGAGAAAVYIAGSAPSTIAVTGGSLSAASAALVLAEGGTGTVSISGGTALTPAMVDGRLLLARATEDAAGNPANLTLNISGMPALTGDVVVDPSTLTYNLSNSAWTGNLVLTGPGNTATASLTASQWTGDLLADAGNTANVALAQASLWTGLARNATNVAIDAGSAWAVTADSNATGTVTNAGLIQFLPRGDAYTTLATGSYAGNNGRIGFNTFLGTDASPSNLLVITGGTATGSTSVLVANTGGPGALTTADGIRIVQVTGGGTTAAGAFTLGQRVAAGAYEYQLFRGGSTDPNDWFLRTSIVTGPAGPTEPSGPAGPTGPSDPTSPAAAPPAGPVIPLYRPEVALYAPIPAIARQMGLATLGTLHERVGEEENIRGLPDTRPYASGAWARAIGERTRSRWSGTVDSRAIGDTFGIQAGFDIIRTNPYSGGHRDQAGVYVAYTNYSAPSVSGFALGLQNLRVGRLSMEGPSVGAYWTHFGPSGWYLDAVFQASWYDVTARSDFGTGLSTNTTGYTASLEAGYPIHFGAGDRWLIEPQAQIIYQGISVDRARDAYSSVDWDEGDAWTGRLGARLQYTGRDEQGTLWQPYARLNLWHAFSGNDGTRFGQSAPTIDTRFGDTALEAGGGVTARVNQNLSFYGQASYRWSLDGGRSRQTAVAGTIGIRFNW